MKALLSRTPGGPETLDFADIPAPVPAEGELLVRVSACGINYPDVLIIEDKYQMRPPRPFVPGGEITGVVESVGGGVQGWKVGDRLVACMGVGGLAEFACVKEAEAFHLDEDRDPIQAAGLLLTYATTIHALVDRARLEPGETLLVLGAAGGVGLAAIQIGKALGARVVAAVSDETKAEAAKAAGADETMVYGLAPPDAAASKALAERFKAATGSADVVYDPVGGDYCEPAFRSLGWGGRYLVIGFPAGIPRLPLNLSLLKSCDVRGVFWGAFAARFPEKNRANVERLFAWWREGKIAPVVGGVWPLERAGDAIAWLGSRRAIGKAVVRIGADSAN